MSPAPPLLPEPRSHSGCATCRTARCCVVFDPELTGADLLRLTSLGLEPDDIAELRPVHAAQAGPDAILLGDDRAWDLRLRRTTAKTPATPIEDSAPDDPAGDARRCGFLVTLGGGLGRCGVYDQRPLVCRLFPSDLTAFGVMVATPEAICPPDAFAQERADLQTLEILHRLARAERAAFRAFLARWNPRSRELRAAASAPPVELDAALRAAFFEALLASCAASPPAAGPPPTAPSAGARTSD